MKVKDVLHVLDKITGGRCVCDAEDLIGGKNRFVLTRSSGIPGKDCTDIPGLIYGHTFSGSVYFERMKNNDLYSTDIERIGRRVAQAGMTGFFAKPAL